MIFLCNQQPFHLLDESPWPIMICYSTFFFLISLIDYFYGGSIIFFFFNCLTQMFLIFTWAKDILREGDILGDHTKEVEKGLKWGMSWFIISEIFFFISFFWGFFHFSLSPSFEGGGSWPPLHIEVMEPFSVPLLNTVILLSSGISLTWAHHILISGKFEDSIYALLITVFLGGYFTFLQLMEYMSSAFCFNDSIYGSIFFIATGFHGCHVIIGTLLLLLVLFRLYKNQFSICHHVGLEISSWYWHFVDVVWLFLFCCLYWWGS